MAFKHLLKISKYPVYFTDLVIIKFLRLKWRKSGIIISKSVVFLGIPILTKAKNSSIAIGDNCLICSRSANTALGVSHMVIIRTLRKEASIIIGKNVRMSGTTICASTKVEIGDRCVIGADVIITDTDFHSLNSEERSSSCDSETAITKSVYIGQDVFIGGRSIILKGVTIGNNAIIGAGSLVTRNVSADTIVAGNPAIEIKCAISETKNSNI